MALLLLLPGLLKNDVSMFEQLRFLRRQRTWLH
jgi:hypothetical protein